MKIFFCFLFMSSVLIAEAQLADTSYSLLWFKGKKIKNNVLLTLNGDTVFYQPTSGTVRMAAKKGNLNSLDRMQKELKNTPARINEMLSKISSALPKHLAPYYAMPISQAFKDVQQQFADALSNNLQLPPMTEANMVITGGVNHGPSYNYINDDLEKMLEVFLQRIKAYGEKIKGEKITDVPTPPKREIGYCFECKQDKSKENKEYEIFIEKLWGEDEEIQTLILSSHRQIQLMGNLEMDQKLRTLTEPVEELIQHRKLEKLKNAD